MTPNTKKARITAAVHAIVAALPGKWEVASTLDATGRVVGLGIVGADGERLCVYPWEKASWGYRIRPLPSPGLRRYFRWPEDHQDPGFTIRTPAANVATQLETTLLPNYRDAINRARAWKQRDQRRQERERAVVATVAEALGAADPSPERDGDDLRCRMTRELLAEVRVFAGGGADRVNLRLGLSVEQAVTVAQFARELVSHGSHNPNSETP